MTRLLMALAAATTLHAATPPAGAAQQRDPNHEIGEPLWMVGLTVLGTTYLLTGATVTTLRLLASAREDRIWEGWVPVAGPFVTLADPTGLDATQVTLTVVSAVLQVLGLGALVTGAVLDAQPDPADPSTGALTLLPMGGPEGVGVAARGEF